jgi:biopolymer transport protein ExbB
MNPEETHTAPAATGGVAAPIDGSIAPDGAIAGAPDAAMASMGLPHNLTPWGMFENADIIVQGIMIGLFVASIITWTVLLAKGVELIMAGRAARAASNQLASARSLAEAGERIQSSDSDVSILVDAALQEIRHSGDLPADGIKERISSHLDQIEATARRRVQRGIGILATIGATAPFVGLFGTVWGIMNSFIGISKAQTTNLAIVAPGIAEALLATALGLVAAIPAVVIYNLFTRMITNYRAQLSDASAGIKRLASRDLDRPRATLRVAAQ